ncbi:hypothetical protein GOODEAATRI_022756 [Goodea atripinnis]|uniref:Uncharacterized protein n=1 Tax=Goodea atripinnis TaxID=208336 RepID=A0ABV0Q096_9TELE
MGDGSVRFPDFGLFFSHLNWAETRFSVLDMEGSHCCMDRGAVLQADDGHDLCSKRRGETTVSVPPSRRMPAMSEQCLASRVEQLSMELMEMKSLLQTRQSDASPPADGLSFPPMPDLSADEDVFSPAASASHFRDEDEVQSS